ncbi:GNAT family N-acetyltransferase [Lysinibacter cavernae]|uniref:Putative GNAT family acetyltransferase n=1 Tax=Lysinibacter cavernae TaxID=1640652 RepID=A0A7X5R382_9MICO|nr:GNAT family N-acetyltransferase [Lysinibacter cavernae]NIH54572.1 putative GNAT family acetyltransferase [Lysinibacter cavernae]
MSELSNVSVRHEPERNRYVIEVDGEVRGEAVYRVSGNALHAIHTEIDPDLRGNGLGDILVTNMINDIRETTSYSVVPQCSYVVEWFQLHPGERDLLTRGTSL